MAGPHGSGAITSGHSPAESRPLEGVRVLDLTRLLPGAYATLMLADLGADVIKIEDPRSGDQSRHMPPLVNGTSVYFTVLNRNKRSVTLNLRAPTAAAILDRLLARSDVLVDSFRPRTAARLGVDAQTIRRNHPEMICASITGFGKTGPYADRAAHDINYEALAGLLSLSGGSPRVPGLLVGDIGAAYQTTSRIVAALFLRERSGLPATIDVSIHEAALQWTVFPSAPRLVRGGDSDPRQLPVRGDAARYNVYETADGRWLALGALEDKFWIAFCERLGRPDLALLNDAQPGDQQESALPDARQGAGRGARRPAGCGSRARDSRVRCHAHRATRRPHPVRPCAWCGYGLGARGGRRRRRRARGVALGGCHLNGARGPLPPFVPVLPSLVAVFERTRIEGRITKHEPHPEWGRGSPTPNSRMPNHGCHVPRLDRR